MTLPDKTVWVPDESGMGGEQRALGEVFWDHDSHRHMVQVDRFVARPPTGAEMLHLARTTPSESGYGWCPDLMTPFFPGMPCVHCGKFVGRNGHFNVEHYEMSDTIASLDAEHHDCPRGAGDDAL